MTETASRRGRDMNITDIVSVRPMASGQETSGWRQIGRDFLALMILAWRTSSLRPNSSRSSGTSNRLAIPLLLFSGIVLIILGIGAGNGMALAVRFLGSDTLAAILNWEALLIFGLLFMTAIPNVLRTYTEQSDLRLLLTTPAAPIAVFAARFCMTLLGSEFLIGCIALPAVISLALALGAAPLSSILAIILVLLLPILPVGLATGTVFVLLHIIPAARARNLTTTLASLTGIAFYLVSRSLFMGSFSTTGPVNAPRILTLPTYTWLAWLPTNWPASALFAALQGAWGSAFAGTALTLALSVAIIGAVVRGAERLFSVGWLNYQEVPRRRARRTRTMAPIMATSLPLQPASGEMKETMAAEQTLANGPAARPANQPGSLMTATSVASAEAPTAASARGAAHGAAPLWALVHTNWRTLLRDPQFIAIFGPRAFSGAIVTFAFLGAHSSLRSLGVGGLVLAMSLYAYFFLGAAGVLVLTREPGGLRMVLTTTVSAWTVLQAMFLAVLMPILLLLEIVMVLLGAVLHMAVVQMAIAAGELVPISIALLALAMLVILLFPGQPSRQSLNLRRIWPSSQAALLGGLGGFILMAIAAGATVSGLLLLTQTPLWWLGICLLLLPVLSAAAPGAALYHVGPGLLERMAFVKNF
jgi:hypothetical protein